MSFVMSILLLRDNPRVMTCSPWPEPPRRAGRGPCTAAVLWSSPGIQKVEDYPEVQLQLLPAPSTAAGGDGHSSPVRSVPVCSLLSNGDSVYRRGPKDQFVANIIWESKFRSTAETQGTAWAG